MKLPRLAHLSRRQLLMGGAAGVVVLSTGTAVALAATRPRDLIFDLMRHALPGITLDREATLMCADDVVAGLNVSFQGAWLQQLTSNAKLRGVRAASLGAGIDRVAALGPVAERLEEITRTALTLLLLNSNFFRVPDPRAETIVYRRPDPNAPCGNPFADLSPPAST